MAIEENRRQAPQPLTGLTVLDFTTLLPGPLATLMLAEAGAEVVKIEPPGGDAMRRLGLGPTADRALYAMLNAGKKSLCLDLKQPDQRQRLEPLLGKADILVEQFRPGVMDRLALGYDELRAINPRLIYCSITGYGQQGPLAQRAGHDLNYLAETGILALNPGPDGSPTVPPVLAADIAGGSYPAFFNILLALMSRARTGAGCHLDIAMTEGLFPFAFWALARGWGEGRWPVPGDAMFNGASPRYRIYTAEDGGLIAVGAVEDRFWERFCEAVDLPSAMRKPDADPAGATAAVAQILAARPASHWRQVFAVADCCCSVVDGLADVVRHPHFAASLFTGSVETESGARYPALPIPVAREFRGEADAVPRAGVLGADNGALEAPPEKDNG